jgi:putative ABC transport system permease protein
VQISALSVGLLALVLLVLLRTDLIASWRNATPPDAPNRFVINVQPEQSEPFQQALREAGVQRFDWYPMIRGRLASINGQPVRADDFDDDRVARLVEREFNLSHTATAPEHNEVVDGRWVDNEPGAISIEAGLAQDLGVGVGDRLGFDIAGQVLESRITSVRKVDWASMRVNFFVVFTQGQMPEVPLTYISAFRAPEVAGFDNRLVRQFPNITHVDMTQTIAQVQRVLGQVISAVEFLFVFTLAAGLVVLMTAITATRGEREREFAILRAVGASSVLLRQVQRIELLGVGLLAGFLASVVAVAVGWALAYWVFEFAWTPKLWVPLAGAVGGAILALLAGWWGLRGVLNTPVMTTLRRASPS